MKPKFQIGDKIIYKNNPKIQKQIVDVTGNSEKRIKGPWISGREEVLVNPNSYILKDLENNKLNFSPILYIDKNYQLIQPVKNEPLKWKNYEEILV